MAYLWSDWDGMGWDGRRGEGQVWYGACWRRDRGGEGAIGRGRIFLVLLLPLVLCCVLDWECKYSISHDMVWYGII